MASHMAVIRKDRCTFADNRVHVWWTAYIVSPSGKDGGKIASFHSLPMLKDFLTRNRFVYFMSDASHQEISDAYDTLEDHSRKEN